MNGLWPGLCLCIPLRRRGKARRAGVSILEDETVVISQGLNVRGVDLPQQDFGVLDARVKQTAQYGLLLELKARYEPNGRGF